MPRSNSVIRRYTPPSCTLEIWAQSSPLSRWMGTTVLKDLRFELNFDAPGLPSESKVAIRGDRDQLQTLCDVVTIYVQELLQQSADNFWLSFSTSLPSTSIPEQLESPDINQPTFSAQTINPVAHQIPEAKIYLEPSENLTHKLFFGSLAHPTSGPYIQLSLLQLFDLATALDEYSADVMALPNLGHETSSISLPTWAPIAAVLVLAVGLAPFTWQYASQRQSNQTQTASKPNSEPANLALQPTPAPNLPTPQPAISPLLLPPAPSSSNPIPLPTLGASPGIPSASIPNPLTVPNSTANTSPQKTLDILGQTKPPLSANPALSLPTTAPNTRPNTTGVISPSNITIASNQAAANLSTKRPPANISPVPQPLASPIAPPLPSAALDLQQLNREISTPADAAAGTSNDLVTKLRSARTTTSSEPAKTATLFDTPQIAEARDYLKKRWQPPAGLADTLEYSLMLGVDGMIERILPLNQAARQYVDNSGIPEIGKPFVSANKAGQSLRIRVVLSPDGKVQTFPETP
jgi:hypothetical protein